VRGNRPKAPPTLQLRAECVVTALEDPRRGSPGQMSRDPGRREPFPRTWRVHEPMR